MKKSILVLLITYYSVIMAKAQNYYTEIHTDAKGYAYETVNGDPSKSRVYTLKNGLKVYLSQNKDEPRIQTYIAVRTGSSNDPSENTGLAHYLEHMLFKGTSKIGTLNWDNESQLLEQISDLYEKHKKETDPEMKKKIYKKIDSVSQEASKYAIANEYDKMISNLGATGTNAHTWLDETIYKNNIPANVLEKWLFVEKERFSELVLRLFHTELEAVYEEFNRAQDNDARLVNYELMDALFPTHNYGQQTTLGKSEHLKNPSMKAIHKYFNTYYVPNNMALVLVGDLEYNKTIQLIDKYFGSFEYKELPVKKKVIEKPLNHVIKRVVKSPTSERLQLAFRTEGTGSKEELYVQMIDMILSNTGAGLIDMNINQKQKAHGAGSYTSIFKDYGIHVLYGAPKEGQTLEQVQQLLLEQLEEIKKGNFEDWLLVAIVKDLKTRRLRSWEKANGVATKMYNAFIQKQSWEEVLGEIDQLRQITKQELMQFANNFYQNNYVVVFKEKGENNKLIRVENPGITPIVLNRTDQSLFYKEFSQIPEKEIKPVFLDYKALIKVKELEHTPFYFIKNTTNELAGLYFIYDFGTDNNKDLILALNYLHLLGTDRYSKSQLEQEFYKAGVTYDVQVYNDRIYVHLKGLEENIPQGLDLLEHLFSRALPDADVYNDYLKTIKKSRKNSKLNKQSIFKALAIYAQYGKFNRITNNISKNELKNKNPQDLVDIIHDLHNYKKEIFYYGKRMSVAEKALLKSHNFGKGLTYNSPIKYEKLSSDGTLYYAPYDMVQAEILFQSKGDLFDVGKMSLARVFNEYFGGGLSSIVFQEIRESRSLAYSAYANYAVATKKENYDFISCYLGTQANKLPQAVEAMSELMNHMPEIDKQFENAKNGALKQIASDRITKSNIFWSYRAARKRGLDYDIRKEIYAKIKEMKMYDLRDFFNKHIKGKKYNVSLIGKKENLDWNAVEKLGKIKELSINELFNY